MLTDSHALISGFLRIRLKTDCVLVVHTLDDGQMHETV
jgi:hypothetical protein